MARRGATDLSGILALDKPAGMTSHDVVAAVRRVTGERRVGHAGTLDPSATGVLVVLVGPATRLAPYLTAARKTYDARIVFGTETDTDDADGTVTRTADVPGMLTSYEAALAHVGSLIGLHEQVPPAYSAVKRDGIVAHRAARAGHDLDLEPRTIEVRDARLLSVEPGPPLAWSAAFEVSKGTYIRALARDLGRGLGTAAHLDGLRRTRSGSITIEDTVRFPIFQKADCSHVETFFLSALRALDMNTLSIDDETAAYVQVGRTIPLDSAYAIDLTTGEHVALVHDTRLVAIYSRRDNTLKPATVIPGGVA